MAQVPPNYLLFARTTQGRAVRELFGVLKDVLHEVSLEFDPQGVHIVCLTPSITCYIHIQLEPDKFETFHCIGKLSLGLHTTNLHKLLKSIATDDTVTLGVSREAPHQLEIRVENSKSSTVVQSMLDSLDIDIHSHHVPDLIWPCVMTMPSVTLNHNCRDLNNLCTDDPRDLVLSVGPARLLTFHLTTMGMSQTITVGETETGMQMLAAPTEDGSATFDLKYLIVLTKASAMSKNVEISLGKDMPLRLVYQIFHLGRIEMILAVRAKDDAYK